MPQISKIKSSYSKAPLPHRKTMLEMRKRILKIIPSSQEVISYGGLTKTICYFKGKITLLKE